MVATESQDGLNRRFISDLASVLGFFNTLLDPQSSSIASTDRMTASVRRCRRTTSRPAS